LQSYEYMSMFSSLLDVHFITITALCRWISLYLKFLFLNRSNIVLVIEGCKHKKERCLKEAGGYNITQIQNKFEFGVCVKIVFVFELSLHSSPKQKKERLAFLFVFEVLVWKAFFVIYIWRLFWDLAHMYDYHCIWWVCMQIGVKDFSRPIQF